MKNKETNKQTTDYNTNTNLKMVLLIVYRQTVCFQTTDEELTPGRTKSIHRMDPAPPEASRSMSYRTHHGLQAQEKKTQEN